MAKLVVKNLKVKIKNKEIIDNLSLEINSGEVHAIMGPNGAGKSTLCSAIMGHSSYTVTKGTMELDGENLLTLPVNERNKKGLFLIMQHPVEIPGVKNSEFMRTALGEHLGKNVDLFSFIKDYEAAAEKVKISENLANRYLNVGFSGGEKKRNEVLQMLMLKPKIALVDEVDSGVDVDGVRIVGETIQELVSKKEMGVLVITHYDRILQYLKPTHVHILKDGKIVKSGGNELIAKIDQEGYDWL